MRKTTVLQTIIFINVLVLLRQLYIADPNKFSLKLVLLFMITLVLLLREYIRTEGKRNTDIENQQYERMNDEYSIFGNNLNNNLN